MRIWCFPWIGHCLFLKQCPQCLTWIPTKSSSRQTLKQNDILGGLTQFLLYLSCDILSKRKSKHVFALTLIFAQMISIFVYTFVCVFYNFSLQIRLLRNPSVFAETLGKMCYVPGSVKL